MHSLHQSRLYDFAVVFKVYLRCCCVFVWQTCYNRCVSSNDVATTIMPSTEIHTQSLSTVTMSTNSSTLAFEEDTKATDVYTSPTTNADMMSVASGWSDAKSCRKPLSYVSGYTLSVLWHVVYWTSQALTWFAVLFFFAVIVILSIKIMI